MWMHVIIIWIGNALLGQEGGYAARSGFDDGRRDGHRC